MVSSPKNPKKFKAILRLDAAARNNNFVKMILNNFQLLCYYCFKKKILKNSMHQFNIKLKKTI